MINSWFQSYLSNRTQTFEIDNHLSDKEVTLCGVPQGSVLGPLLFLLYINDVLKSSKELSFHLFADDTTLTYAHKNPRVLESTVNLEFAKVVGWLKPNKLTLDIKKSNFVIFRPRQIMPFIPQINVFNSVTNT